MSFSTAAVPNQAANANQSWSLDSSTSQDVRKRTLGAVNKKPDSETPAGGGANRVPDDKTVVSGKDRSHTIRGKSVLPRPKDPSVAKKELVASALVARRKKNTPRPEKPTWRVALDILMKSCLLAGLVFWLGQSIWRWKVGKPSIAASDADGRLLEVEASLKMTAKMLQVQLDIVDKKIGTKIDKAKKDLVKLVEDKGTTLEMQMKTLEGRNGKLDESVTALNEMGFISKKEFQVYLDDLKSNKRSAGSDQDLSLDAISEFAKEIVGKEIEKHAADGLGMVDYALASGGARVVRHSEPYAFGKAGNWFTGSKVQHGVHPNAQKMLEPTFGEPGQCFALQGSNGFVEIKLRIGIIPEAITLEHVAKSVAYDRSSAPKDCRVTAWYEGPDDDPSKHSEVVLVLTEFSYDLEKSNAQTFNVEITNSRVVNMVRLDFSSNHGSSSLTCIYRFRVHGHEPGSFGTMA